MCMTLSWPHAKSFHWKWPSKWALCFHTMDEWMYLLMRVLVWMNVLGIVPEWMTVLSICMAWMNLIGSWHGTDECNWECTGMDEMYLGRVHVAMLFFCQFGDKPKWGSSIGRFSQIRLQVKYESRNFLTALKKNYWLTWTMYKNLPIFLYFFGIMAIEIFSHFSFSFSLFGYIQQVKLWLRSCRVRVPLWNPNLVRGVCTARERERREEGARAGEIEPDRARVAHREHGSRVGRRRRLIRSASSAQNLVGQAGHTQERWGCAGE